MLPSQAVGEKQGNVSTASVVAHGSANMRTRPTLTLWHTTLARFAIAIDEKAPGVVCIGALNTKLIAVPRQLRDTVIVHALKMPINLVLRRTVRPCVCVELVDDSLSLSCNFREYMLALRLTQPTCR